MNRLPCGCFPAGTFEQQVKEVRKTYKTVIVVKHFNVCCDKCASRNRHICDIQTELTIDEVSFAHGISLQRSYSMMKEFTDDQHTLEPLKKSVRYADEDTPKTVTEFAHKISVILNALAQVHLNGSVIRLVALEGILVVSLQGFVIAA